MPVPRWTYLMPRLVSFVYQKRPALAQLRGAQLAELLHKRFARDRWPGDSAADSLTWQVADRVFADLTSVNRATGSILVVLFLPTVGDSSDSGSDRWRRWLRLAAVQRGFVFVDLVEDFRAMPHDSMAWLFYKAPPARPDPSGHYGELGNEWVADRLYRHLMALPATAARLDPPPRTGYRDSRGVSAP